MFRLVSWNYKIFVSDPEPKQNQTGQNEDQQGKKRQIRAKQSDTKMKQLK
jgi:hypothetical protein